MYILKKRIGQGESYGINILGRTVKAPFKTTRIVHLSIRVKSPILHLLAEDPETVTDCRVWNSWIFYCTGHWSDRTGNVCHSIPVSSQIVNQKFNMSTYSLAPVCSYAILNLLYSDLKVMVVPWHSILQFLNSNWLAYSLRIWISLVSRSLAPSEPTGRCGSFLWHLETFTKISKRANLG